MCRFQHFYLWQCDVFNGVKSEYLVAQPVTHASVRQVACGPALPEYIRGIEQRCTTLWTSGRQRCERTSILGFPCVHVLEPVVPLPPTPDAPLDVDASGEALDSSDLGTTDCRSDAVVGSVGVGNAERIHDNSGSGDDGFHGNDTSTDAVHRGACSSGHVLRCACTCGRRQDAIADPFALRDIARFHFRGPCCLALPPSRRMHATTHARRPAPHEHRFTSGGLPGVGPSITAKHASAADDDDILPGPEIPPGDGIAGGTAEEEENEVVEVLLHGRGNVDERSTSLATPFSTTATPPRTSAAPDGDGGSTPTHEGPGSIPTGVPAPAEPCFTLTQLGVAADYDAARGLKGPGFGVGSADAGGIAMRC